MEDRKSSANQKAKSLIKGIRISWMNTIIIVVSCILYILLTATADHASRVIRDTYNSMDEFADCMEIESLFRDGSDYLTEQAQFYVVTEEQKYIEDYFVEVDETRRREVALESLAQYDIDEKTSAYLQSALEKSDALMEQELYAMRLVLAAKGNDMEFIPKKMQEMALDEEDLALSADEMEQKAQALVFGTEYQEAKRQIDQDVRSALNGINNIIKQQMEAGNDKFKVAMVIHKILIGLNCVASLGGFFWTTRLVVLPIWNYVKAINEGTPLKVMGAYECRCLAQSCNAMFERNADHEQMLRHQAEHDALTGLLNRGAFDEMQQALADKDGPLGLLMVDVDKFKSINDNYGHEIGDRVLKKVAGLLKDSFRATDYPARVGGDEFAVILMDVPQEQKSAILAKIEIMNDTLTHPEDGLPVVSLSVGGAFSEDGFTDSLYKHADLALYEVKENGRCGCRFYQANPQSEE